MDVEPSLLGDNEMLYQTWFLPGLNSDCPTLVKVDAWMLGDDYCGESVWTVCPFTNPDDFYTSELYQLLKLEAVQDYEDFKRQI